MQPITMYVYIFIIVYGCMPNDFHITIYVSMSSLFSKPSMAEAWINDAYFLIVSKETPTMQSNYSGSRHSYMSFLAQINTCFNLFHCSYAIVPPWIAKKFGNKICSFSKEIWKRNKRMELHVWVNKLKLSLI